MIIHHGRDIMYKDKKPKGRNIFKGKQLLFLCNSSMYVCKIFYCRLWTLLYITHTPRAVKHVDDKGCWRRPHYLPYINRMHYD